MNWKNVEEINYNTEWPYPTVWMCYYDDWSTKDYEEKIVIPYFKKRLWTDTIEIVWTEFVAIK
jgi:hypothetical protein